jgi:hypothetical protein
MLLVQALLLLREVAQRQKLPAEHVAYCLELSCVISSLSMHDSAALDALIAHRQLVLPPPEQLSTAAVAALLSGQHDAARLQGIMKTSSLARWG